jgi:hypothetical protein
MNVLILTPDAVGSTLLQRLITIYMQFHEYDRPVINLHELTNGLIKYYSPEFNCELLGKPRAGNWGYYQSLEEIVGLLNSVDHYKTSRLAQYHIKNRQDKIDQQIPFYNYLNENFFVISCRRENVFEHAISWALNKITKKLNVYTPEEKISTFFNLFKNQIDIDPAAMLQSLEDYKNYLDWSENHFNIGSYFQYDHHLNNIEKYILNLPIFVGQTKHVSWNDVYGLELNDWNRCHYYASDIGSLAMKKSDSFNLLAGVTNDQNNSVVEYHARNLINYLPDDRKDFLKYYANDYIKVNQSITRMNELGILVGGIPIKKQTLAEKKFIIKNFDHCVDIYNEWALHNCNIAKPIDSEKIALAYENENTIWNARINNSTKAAHDQLSIGLSADQNDSHHD